MRLREHWGNPHYLSWNSKHFALYLAFLITRESRRTSVNILKSLRVAMWGRVLFGVPFDILQHGHIQRIGAYLMTFRDAQGLINPGDNVVPYGYSQRYWTGHICRGLESEELLMNQIPELLDLV